MAEANGVERFARFEDKRMWRLLLARLHPDAGGDHELFTFACAVRDEVLGVEGWSDHPERDKDERSQQARADVFLRAWQDAMGRWSSSNHNTLRGFHQTGYSDDRNN